MRIRHAFVTAATFAALAAPAFAKTSVTVYSQDLAFVREMRTLALAGARDTVLIADIPERIDVASVRLVPEAGKVERLSYRYDVGNGDAMLESARGGRVRVAMRDNRQVEGTLLASDGAWLIVRQDDGSIHNLSRVAVDDVRTDVVAGGLVTRPSLQVAIEGARKGNVNAELSYLTGGLSWSAEHTLVKRSETSVSWSSGVTVDNQTGRDFVDVSLGLVAGDPRRVGGPIPMPAMREQMSAMAYKGADLSEQTFSEYHLYTVDGPASLRNKETQKLTMLEPRNVQVTPKYRFQMNEGAGVRAQLEVQNTKAAGLGVPLPGGRVRVFEPDAKGEVRFTGESTIRHTPEGEKLTIDVGQAFDLVAERRETHNRQVSEREREYGVEVKLRNRKTKAVTIAVEETVGGDFEVIAKSHPFTRKDANTIVFDVPVPAGKEVVVTYSVRVRY